MNELIKNQLNKNKIGISIYLITYITKIILNSNLIKDTDCADM